MSNLWREKLELQIDRELRYQLDDVIVRLRALAKEFDIGREASKRSPLRNILLVASDPTSSLEVIKTYIRYQTGRKEGSEVWKIKQGNRLFADAVIEQLEELQGSAEKIFKEIQQSQSEDDSYKGYFQTAQYARDLKDLHLRLAQLYLGSLVREHTALVAESGGNTAKKEDEKTFNQPKNSQPSKAIERPKPASQKRY